jgi:hypothetical protein
MVLEVPIEIATKVPEVVGRNFSLVMTKIKEIDTEKGRALMLIDIDNGKQMPTLLKAA